MSSQQKVRSACENCHRRKIRCHLPKAGGACQNCSTSGSSCYFAPRVKAGRPRLTDLEQRQAPYRDYSSKSPRLANKPFPDANSIPLLSDDSHSTPNALFSASQNTGEATLVDDLHAFGLLSPMQTAQTREQNASFHDGISISSNQVLNDSTLGFLTSSSASFETSHGGVRNLPSSFDVILRSCEDLDRHCRSLEGLNYHINSMYTVLNSMESACEMSKQASLSLPSSDGASIALMAAAFYKVFEICEKIIGGIGSSSMSQEQSLDMLVFLKRLDLVLLQTKIVLVRINHLDAAKTASQIHQWIESYIKQHCHSWSW